MAILRPSSALHTFFPGATTASSRDIRKRRFHSQNRDSFILHSTTTTSTTTESNCDDDGNAILSLQPPPPPDINQNVSKTIYTIDDTVCEVTDPTTLANIVSKNAQNVEKYVRRLPMAEHNREAFCIAERFVKDFEKSRSDGGMDKMEGIILDSGCGTARSTILLGKRYPNHAVIGVDRSLPRLNRNVIFRTQPTTTPTTTTDTDTNIEITTNDDINPPNRIAKEEEENQRNGKNSSTPLNVLLLQADLTEFWIHCLDADWTLSKHYLLYPNPYPKKKRLKNRWYAHSSFPLLLKLGGDIVVRSNWEGYLMEFAAAVRVLLPLPTEKSSVDFASEENGDNQKECPEDLSPVYSVSGIKGPFQLCGDDYSVDKAVPMTNFEKKYIECGEPIYELKVDRCQT